MPYLDAPLARPLAHPRAGLAHAYEGLWDSLMDALLDERPFVVGLAAAAAAQLLAPAPAEPGAAAAPPPAASPAAPAATPAGFMRGRVADRAARRLSAALGPVLEMCALVPTPGQVAVCDLLLALVQRCLAQTLADAAGVCAPPSPPEGVPVPDLGSLVSYAAAYLAALLQSGDPAARVEACGAVLVMAGDLAEAGPAAAGGAGGLPQSLVVEAALGLVGMRDREYVEAGLADVVELLVRALPALLVRVGGEAEGLGAEGWEGWDGTGGGVGAEGWGRACSCARQRPWAVGGTGAGG
jgi:hypothetical protein